MTGFSRVTGIGTEVTLDGKRHLLADVPLPERTGTANAGLPPRPAAIRMTLAMRPAEGLATTLGIPADLAFAGKAWCWLEDAMPLVAADSTLQPHALADLLRAGFFSPSDDAALHLATRLLLSDEEACRASIAEAVRRDLFWLVSRTRHNAEAIADRLPDCRPTVVLMNPPFSATPGVGRIRHDADLRHLRAAFAMLSPGGQLAAVTSAQCVPGDPAWTAAFAQRDPPVHCVFTLAIDGRAYARRGTGFDTRLTVLARVPRSGWWNPYRLPSAPTPPCSAAPGRPSPPTPRPETTRKRGNRAAPASSCKTPCRTPALPMSPPPAPPSCPACGPPARLRSKPGPNSSRPWKSAASPPWRSSPGISRRSASTRPGRWPMTASRSTSSNTR